MESTLTFDSLHVFYSLGGALATLMAYKMAGSERGLITKPVTCITFASPRAGSSGFRTAFEVSKHMNAIRHAQPLPEPLTIFKYLLGIGEGWSSSPSSSQYRS